MKNRNTTKHTSLLLFLVLIQMLIALASSWAAAQNPIKVHSTPIVNNGWIYFQRADDQDATKDNGLYKIRTNGKDLTFLNCYLKSSPSVSDDGWITFQGIDDCVYSISKNGQELTLRNDDPSSFFFSRNSVTCGEGAAGAASGALPYTITYFKDADCKLMESYHHDGSDAGCLYEGIASAPVVANTLFSAYDTIYFQGTDNRLLKTSPHPQNWLLGKRTKFLNNHTLSQPLVIIGEPWLWSPSYIFFQGTDSRLLRCDTDGNYTTFLNNYIKSSPSSDDIHQVLHSALYFQSTDDRLLKCDLDGKHTTDFEATDVVQ